MHTTAHSNVEDRKMNRCKDHIGFFLNDQEICTSKKCSQRAFTKKKKKEKPTK